MENVIKKTNTKIDLNSYQGRPFYTICRVFGPGLCNRILSTACSIASCPTLYRFDSRNVFGCMGFHACAPYSKTGRMEDFTKEKQPQSE